MFVGLIGFGFTYYYFDGGKSIKFLLTINDLKKTNSSKEKECVPFWYIFGDNVVVENSLILLLPLPIHLPLSSANNNSIVSVEIIFSL